MVPDTKADTARQFYYYYYVAVRWFGNRDGASLCASRLADEARALSV